MDINGVYSVVASATAGSSLGVIRIQSGQITGNDIGGAEYSGTAARAPDGSVAIEINMSTPPGVTHIWTGADTETFQTRAIATRLSKASFEEGAPHHMPDMGMTLIFRRIPDEYSPLAGPEGRRHVVSALLRADQAWASYRAQ